RTRVSRRRRRCPRRRSIRCSSRSARPLRRTGACKQNRPSSVGSVGMSPTDLFERARELLARTPVVDGHNDLLWEAREKVGYDFDRLDIASPCPEVMTDIPRIREGRLGGQFWSVYVPSNLPGDSAVTATLEQIDALFGMVARYADAFELAWSAEDVERVTSAGRVGSMIGVEG